MNEATDMVLDYVSQHPQYKACIGLLCTRTQAYGYLHWGAVHRYSGKHYVPFLSSIERLDPEACWMPLTPEALRKHIRNNNDAPAFLLSEQDADVSTNVNHLSLVH